MNDALDRPETVRDSARSSCGALRPRYAFMLEGVKGLTRAAVRVVETDRIDVITP